jgi:hypothetical protein
MNKSEILSFFANAVSPTCAGRTFHDAREYELAGRRCRVQVFDDGTVDLWCVQYPSLDPLSTIWLNRREAELRAAGMEPRRLDGELLVRGGAELKAWILANLQKLGLRRKRLMSGLSLKRPILARQSPVTEAPLALSPRGRV